tara:strand:- start:240 stop:536 length:297 start_codon:yes stop_codon:yes gene_type:complete
VAKAAPSLLFILMPVYEYKSDTGEVIELERPITERNDAPDGYTRMIYPSRISVPNGASDEKGMNKESVRRGYYDQEQKMGSRWRSKHSVKAIKRAWEI